MLKVEVSGSYYTVAGGNQNEIGYEFTKEIPEVPENWVTSLLRNRFVPMWLEEEHKKAPSKNPKFNYKHNPYMPCFVSHTEITKTKDGIAGKDVFEMNEKELQYASAKYLLTEVPLPNTVPLRELRNQVALNYLKVVKGVKIDKNEDKEKLAFFKKTPAGEWMLDFGKEKFILEEFEPKEESFEKPVEKQTLQDVLKQSSDVQEKTKSHELTEEELEALEG